jgi:glutamyl/glutaminyl-tRNA synthetase
LKEGKAYRCYCTQEEMKKRCAIGEDGEYCKYDGFCRNLKEQDLSKPHAIRFKLPENRSVVEFNDIIRGFISIGIDQLDDFIIAERDNKSRPYAIAGHTKLLITQGDFHGALDIGSELLKKKHTKPMLYMLAAAAKGAGDDAKFNWLVKQAEALPDVQPGSGKILLMRQSIRILIENKQFDVAKALLMQLAQIDKPTRVKTFESQIERELAALSLV